MQILVPALIADVSEGKMPGNSLETGQSIKVVFAEFLLPDAEIAASDLPDVKSAVEITKIPVGYLTDDVAPTPIYGLPTESVHSGGIRPFSTELGVDPESKQITGSLQTAGFLAEPQLSASAGVGMERSTATPEGSSQAELQRVRLVDVVPVQDDDKAITMATPSTQLNRAHPDGGAVQTEMVSVATSPSLAPDEIDDALTSIPASGISESHTVGPERVGSSLPSTAKALQSPAWQVGKYPNAVGAPLQPDNLQSPVVPNAGDVHLDPVDTNQDTDQTKKPAERVAVADERARANTQYLPFDRAVGSHPKSHTEKIKALVDQPPKSDVSVVTQQAESPTTPQKAIQTVPENELVGRAQIERLDERTNRNPGTPAAGQAQALPPAPQATTPTNGLQRNLAAPDFPAQRDAMLSEPELALGLTTESETENTRPQASTVPRIEALARPVMQQLQQVILRSGNDGQIEVRLSPEELGRVKLAMSPIEAGVAIHITAERSETLELMRRNIEMLESDLRGQGFENLEFTFGQEQQENPPEGEPLLTDAMEQSEPGIVAEVVSLPRAVHGGRVDIRL